MNLYQFWDCDIESSVIQKNLRRKSGVFLLYTDQNLDTHPSPALSGILSP